MPDWLSLYHRSPYALRVVAASLRGYYLRTWRYGLNHEERVKNILTRDQWTAQQWKDWQDNQLAFLLHRAATQVPYYREMWAERRRKGDRSSWDDLENWPILEKDELKAKAKAFVADDCNPERMFHEHTSGTTGKSLDLWWSRETVREWYALFEARGRRWHGVSRKDRWVILGGQLVTPAVQRTPPFWVWNAALNQLYMSSYHLAPDLIPAYLDAIKRYKIQYLWGYTSSLYALAQEVLRLGREDLQMSVVITNAEPVYDYQRAAIQKAFKCPVRETYGMAEIAATASECENGHLHIWPESGIIEVFQGNQPVPNGEIGDLICTGLLNTDMPLIRYRVGDRGTLPKENNPCPCGRALPLLESVEGRIDDMLYTMDGRMIGRLDPVFKAQLPVLEAQIIQETLDTIRVRYVPAPEYTKEDGESIVTRLQARMGPVRVILETLDELPREANGKFRAVISHIKKEEKSNSPRNETEPQITRNERP